MPKIEVVDIDNKSYILESEGYEYMISSKHEWNALSNPKQSFILVNYPSGIIKTPIDKKFLNNQNYKLETDLDFIGFNLFSWNNFTGILNGNNKTISNINSVSDNFIGLFGNSNHCTIKNLHIHNCTICNSMQLNGVIISNVNFCDLINIKMSGNFVISGKYSGIISCNITGNISDININIKSNINNLFNSFSGQFKNSYINITTSNANPLFSNNFNGNINNCLFVNNQEKIIKNIIDGMITNNIFIFNCEDIMNLTDKKIFFNCILKNKNETIIFNKANEIVNEFVFDEWDKDIWTSEGSLILFKDD
jgi:hypothetical protein